MLNKRYIFIIFLFIIAIGTITSVSADDVDNSTMACEDEVSLDAMDSQIDGDAIRSTENGEALLDDVKTFTDLENQITDAPEGSTLKISGYYKGTGSAITINKDITIEGDGNTVIDADGKSRIFKIIGHKVDGKYISYNVVLKNLILKNGVDTESYGAAVSGYHFNDADYQTVYNCTIMDCRAKYGGGFENLNAVNCVFINNRALQYGGAMYYGSAQNCKFINNTAVKDGGAVYGNAATVVKNSKFINNRAGSMGDDMFNGIATDCVFSSSNSTYATKITKSMKPKITLTQSGKYFGSKKITVKVIDTNNGNKAVSGATVTLKFSNGKTVKVKTGSNGIATYSMAFNPKTYSVTASFKTAKASLSKVKIIKAPSKITAGKVSTRYGDKYFKVKAVNTKTKEGVAGAKILLKVYTGKKYKKVYITTDSKGVAKYGGADLSVAKHKIVVSGASSGIKAKAKTSQMTILKSPAKIASSKLSFTDGEKKSFTVKVTSTKNKKALHDVRLLVKVYTGSKFKKVKLTTDSKGTAKYDASKLAVGKHKVSVSIQTPAVKAKAKSSEITVKKYVPPKKETAITDNNPIVVEYVYNAGSITGFKATFTVYDPQTKTAISGARINVYVNSQLLHENVLSGSSVVISPTTCAVTVTYDGDSTYESSIRVFEYRN